MKRYISQLVFGLLEVAIVTGLVGEEPADTLYDESLVPAYTLPQIIFPESTPEETLRKWQTSRREDVLELFEEHVYGRVPEGSISSNLSLVEEDRMALGGLARRCQWVLSLSNPSYPERTVNINILGYFPADSDEIVPVFLGLNFSGNQTIHPDPEILMSTAWMRDRPGMGIVNHRATEESRGAAQSRWSVEMILNRGYGLVTAYYGDIDPDSYDFNFSDGVHPLFYNDGQERPTENEWGSIAAWAWGLEQIRRSLAEMDYIQPNKVAVIGHSRLGKTALWAGARYENFGMVVGNNSGCGGAALYRRCYGERIHHILPPVGYWFCRKHAQYAHAESSLPVDQHMLLALIAPRGLYVASATEDRWSDPKGEFLALKSAAEVYSLYGKDWKAPVELPSPGQPVIGPVGYHLREGKHDLTPYDWSQYLDFADKHLK